MNTGDFHFTWECLGLVADAFWGSQTTKGTLCQLKDAVHRTSVTKQAKPLTPADEFLTHVYFPLQTTSSCT